MIVGQLKYKDQKAKLVIVGDGELRMDLLILCNQLKLMHWTCWSGQRLDISSDVYFVGQQTNPFKYLSKSSLFIMTSNWEGFPLALGEALACGLRVISSDCYTGPREIIVPELRLQQPVSQPVFSAWGALMPLAVSGASDSVDLWTSVIIRLMSEESIRCHSRMVSIKRADCFRLSDTIEKTFNVVNEVFQ